MSLDAATFMLRMIRAPIIIVSTSQARLTQINIKMPFLQTRYMPCSLRIPLHYDRSTIIGESSLRHHSLFSEKHSIFIQSHPHYCPIIQKPSICTMCVQGLHISTIILSLVFSGIVPAYHFSRSNPQIIVFFGTKPLYIIVNFVN